MRLRTLILPILLAGAAFAQDAAFAFANQKGNALLTIAPESLPINFSDAALFDTALCDDGRQYQVRFIRGQPSAPGDNGRALASNFERYSGYRFQVVKGRVPTDANCLLARQHFFDVRRVVPMKPWATRDEAGGKRPPDCPAATRQALATPEGRAVVQCARLAQIGSDTELLAVEYERRGDQMLGAVVLLRGSSPLLVKYPASASSTSAWRVDDQGKWEAGSFVPLFVFERISDGGLEIAVQWSGPEGARLIVYRALGDALQPIDFGYRYWAPL